MIQTTAPTVAERLPPHDIEAEMCLVGSLLHANKPEDIARAKVQIWPDACYLADNQIVLAAIFALHDKGEPTDAVSVRADLKQRGLLEEIGGAEYLARLLRSVPSAKNFPAYAKAVARHAQQREGIAAGYELLERMYDGNEPGAVFDDVGQRITDARHRGEPVHAERLGTVAERWLANRMTGEGNGLLTGWRELDHEYMGVCSLGSYTLVAARPSMGKSTWVRQLLLNRSAAGHRCGLIAIEEQAVKVASNAVASQMGQLLHPRDAFNLNARLANGPLTPAELANAKDAAAYFQSHDYWIIDTAFTLEKVLAAVDTLVHRHKCTWIAVDHVHLISHGKAENRTQQLKEISEALKSAFKRHHVAGIVAAQLSRPATKGEPDAPQSSDLRESGALEEHADAILMLHRQDYYHRGEVNYEPNFKCEVYVRKNRNGPAGMVLLKSRLDIQRFEDWDGVPEGL